MIYHFCLVCLGLLVEVRLSRSGLVRLLGQRDVGDEDTPRVVEDIPNAES